MAQRETREAAQERILELQDDLMKRLEANPKYQELSPESQQQVVQTLTPQLFDPKYEMTKYLKDIQVNKSLIGKMNSLAIERPDESESCAEIIDWLNRQTQEDLTEIKRIQRGDFEWLVK